jgi:predicted HicB family RNase H-like nuclease
MSQVLNVELSEEVFAAIQHQAKSAGISPAHWVADMLENQYRFLI